MPRIIFIANDGTEHLVEAEPGRTLMDAAVNNMVPGILADCGGACSCATCHAYVDPAWYDRLPVKSEDEAMMLEGALDVESTSRLCCQVKMQADLDGIVVRVPSRQI